MLPSPPSSTFPPLKSYAADYWVFSFPATPTPLLRSPPPPRPLFPKPALSSTFPLFASPSFSYSFQHQFPRRHHQQNPDSEQEGEDIREENVLGDCLVFDDGAFEGGNPFLPHDPDDYEEEKKRRPRGKKQPVADVEPENLVPDKWAEAVAEINLTKKEKRKIAQELKFGSRVERRKKLPMPDLGEYVTYRSMKLSQLHPVVLDNPREFPPPTPPKEEDGGDFGGSSGGRVLPRNPRLDIGEGSLEAITDFFNSGEYVPGENSDDKKPGKRKLFTMEEKALLNKRVPYLADATSRKWLPLHTLAASGEFYLMDMLLKHNVDINAADKDGLCAIHKAILGKKQAIINYLLRESANPFVRDQEGATLMHYAVFTASTQIIKILLLYNVDMNLSDDDGWTPLHLAVQTLRTDIVRLLLIKGADKTLKNQDGLTPLDLCLYSGQNARTYELIKLLKELPRTK